MLPRNSLVLIRRVMLHFKLDAGMYLTIAATSGAHTHLPIDEPAPLLGILGSCVELQAAPPAPTSMFWPNTPMICGSRPS